MAVANSEPKFSKRRKLGKNKKKAWRASNANGIEDFIADQSRQIRTGGIVSEKSDATLFVLDKRISEQVSDHKKRKRERRNKPLKCLSLLEPSPYVKPVRKPEQDGFQKGNRTKRLMDRLQERSQSATRKTAQEQRKRALEEKEVQKQRKRKLPEVEGDLWADDDTKTAVKRPKGLRRKPSALGATMVPHSGASFNPSFEDHQALLLEAHSEEVVKEKKEKKLFNALDAMFPSKEELKLNEIDHLKDMSAGLFEDSEEESKEEDSEEEVPDSFSVGAPVRREDRKTRKQKRVQLAEKDKAKLRTDENEIKRRENMVFRIPTLKAELNKLDRKKQQTIAKRKQRNQQKSFKTKRLNSVKFEEQDKDLKLSTELVASLRELKPEGHVMNDVYKSLQRRNIIEPRQRQNVKRKYKPKVFEKKGHKAVTL